MAHKLGPAIAGGNAVILKPATVTPLSALKLCEAFMEAGLPPGVLQCLTGHGAALGDALVSDERVRMVSFTGGVEAGERIVSKAGLKKIGMELGSNSPVIVWKDADIEWAVETCVSGAFWAAGQNCIGVQRIYIHRDVYDRFRDTSSTRTKAYTIGNKLDEATDMGPMINEGEAKRVERWVEEAVEKGATVLAGGSRDGALMEPTVLENVPEECHHPPRGGLRPGRQPLPGRRPRRGDHRSQHGRLRPPRGRLLQRRHDLPPDDPGPRLPVRC